MAITVRERPAPPAPLAEQLSIDLALLERPEAQRARRRGLLRAKVEALRAAEGLVGWARPLLVGVLIVSFLHLWHQIARIAPAGVPALQLPAWTHWLSAALLTLSVDATALYLVATRSAAQYARLGGQGALSVWFFYLLTAALNSLFVLSYTPGLPTQVQAVTPALSLLGAVLLGLLVPISIAALERARQVADVARLSLLVEVETLRGLEAVSQNGADVTASQNAAGRDPVADERMGEDVVPAIGGRPQQYRVEDMIARLQDLPTFSPAEARRALGASESSVRRLLAEGLHRGLIVRRGAGAYAVARPQT